VSIRVQSWVWHNSRATGAAFVVLLKIADNAGDDGANAWPSVAHLAAMCRCSESTVHRAITELQRLGELEVKPRAGGTSGARKDRATNRYRVVMTCQPDTPKQAVHNSATGCQYDTRSAPRGVKNSPTGCLNEPDEVSLVTPEPSIRTIQNRGPGEEKIGHAAWAERCRQILRSDSRGGDLSETTDGALPVSGEVEP
jgi:DNA-binding transcriptional MocR family regulator